MSAERTLFAMSSDPGTGDPRAPVGTRPWAEHWRLVFQTYVQQMDASPEVVEQFRRLGEEHRAWTLLNKRDGSRFEKWEEFCEYPRPWGLEIEPERFKKYLIAKYGERVVQTETARPDGRKFRERDEQGHYVQTGHDVPNGSEAEQKHAKRMRAVLRAPQPIQQLYQDELIGQKEAARLGPDRPTPEQAARLAEVTETVRSLARGAERGDRAVARKVNAQVREMLGTKHDPVDAAVRALKRLPDDRVIDAVYQFIVELPGPAFGKLWGKLARLQRPGGRR